MPKKLTKKAPTQKKSPGRKARKKETPLEAAKADSRLAAPTEEQIRERAYEIFLAGRNPMDPVADWFQAEGELRASS